MANVGQNYMGSKLRFTDRLGAPADIDLRNQPRVEYIAGDTVVTINNFVKGDETGLVTCDVLTNTAGAVEGDVIADPDLSEGEKELRVHFAFVIDPLEATGGSFELGAGVDK